MMHNLTRRQAIGAMVAAIALPGVPKHDPAARSPNEPPGPPVGTPVHPVWKAEYHFWNPKVMDAAVKKQTWAQQWAASLAKAHEWESFDA